MEGTAAVRRPRNSAPPSPNKKRVEKNTKSPRKIKERQPSDTGTDRVKSEASESGYGTAEGTPEVGPEVASIKREHVSTTDENLLYSIGTPINSEPPTPSPGFAASQDMDDMMSSFRMPAEHMSQQHLSHGSLFHSVMEDPNQAYGLGMQMSLGLVDPFENLWHQPPSHTDGEENVPVKTEERWEETYHQA